MPQARGKGYMKESDMGQTPVLEATHLGIEFGGLKAVDDFNITVPAEIFTKLISKMTSESIVLSLDDKILEVKGNGKRVDDHAAQIECDAVSQGWQRDRFHHRHP